MQHLKSSPESRPDLTYLAKHVDGELKLEGEHLACFDGGNFILGGQVLKRQDLVDFGLELVRGCYHTYNSTATKIGPESFGWDAEGVPEEERGFFEKNGFYIKNSDYAMRPEVIESYYHAYRATGDRMVKIQPLPLTLF